MLKLQGQRCRTWRDTKPHPLPVAERLPAFARWVDAQEPQRVSAEDALEVAGEEAVYYHTRLTGASNKRAKEQLGFAPRQLLWKDYSA